MGPGPQRLPGSLGFELLKAWRLRADEGCFSAAGVPLDSDSPEEGQYVTSDWLGVGHVFNLAFRGGAGGTLIASFPEVSRGGRVPMPTCTPPPRVSSWSDLGL